VHARRGAFAVVFVVVVVVAVIFIYLFELLWFQKAQK